MKCQVLVTGGAGFIGSHVADELLGKGYSALVLDDLSGGLIENVPAGAQFVRGSINNVDLINRLFARHSFEYVFHFAAYAAENLSHFVRRFNYASNILGTINLINAAVNTGTVKCFVFSSSIAVYGCDRLSVRESVIPRPMDLYGIAKYAVEMDLQASRRLFGLNYIIFRPHNVYGERQNMSDPFRNVIAIFMRQVMQRRPMTVFGGGRQRRAFTHIGSVAPIIAASIQRPSAYNQVFNVGSDRAYTVLQTARTVAAVLGVKPEFSLLRKRVELEDVSASHTKAKRQFGDLMCDIPLIEGVRRMAAWARSANCRQPEVFRHFEIHRNLPAGVAENIEDGMQNRARRLAERTPTVPDQFPMAEGQSLAVGILQKAQANRRMAPRPGSAAGD